MAIDQISLRVPEEKYGPVLDAVQEAGARLIDLQFSDIVGGAKTLTIPAELLPRVMRDGYRFDGSALTGGHRKIELDLFLVPDPQTLALYPWEGSGERRARLSCSVLRRDGQPFAGDPRSVLERNLAAARALGYDYRVAVEMEYYLLPGDGTLPDQALGSGYFSIGAEEVALTRDAVLTALQAWAFPSAVPTTRLGLARKSWIFPMLMPCAWPIS